MTAAPKPIRAPKARACLLYTSDAADERSSVDLGGRRIIKKKKESDKRRGSDVKKADVNVKHTVIKSITDTRKKG